MLRTHMRYRRHLLATAGAAVAAAGVTAPAEAAKRMEVTLQDDAIFVQDQGYYPREEAYDRLKELGVSRLRFNVIWANQLEPSSRDAKKAPRKPRYDFDQLDVAVKTARKHKVRVQLTLTGPAPRWGARDSDNGRVVKPNAKRFGQFARTVARRYRKYVDVYSIWNEPNHKAWLQPVSQQGRLYRDLYYQGYKAVKRYDRKAKVLIAETAPYASKKGVATPPLEFLRDVTCVDKKYRYKRKKGCRALIADGYAHHPYDFERAPNKRRKGSDSVTMANLSSLTRALDKLKRARRLRTSKGRALDLYLTEFGYFAAGPGKVFKEKTRAKYLLRGFQMAQRNKRVRAMLQYVLVSPPPERTRFNTSVIDADGTLTRPFRSLAKWTKKARKKKLVR
jgi:hypothetical protein